ncbi:tRNA1(Val) (adenine(37)-N6)-methyltransferase [Planctobacterium marinum]|uniref:tRNA1(Val) (adenine(37)-N6)-methyltransferase n=1 Tax=Planctobacterium marinum TaxID=1631968 RepID=A0AA48HIU4_9ALTE|nr:tRNA1(Val) (adenine(37)-N6)-methyltransferase [Planctobacterium marinum]
MFRCKQFVVQQDKCAMKVSTDSLLLGSWCRPGSASTILDIGTGTGILSLMMAQKSHSSCRITAVEIDDDAALQAKENFRASPWPDKLTLFHADFSDWWQQNRQRYDVILANPPWFEYAPSAAHNTRNQQRDEKRTVARQQSTLNLELLFQSVATLLTSAGHFYLVLPASAELQVEMLAEKLHFGLLARLDVKATPAKAPYCQLWHLGDQAEELNGDDINRDPENNLRAQSIQEIIVRDVKGDYTDTYKTLCRDFYLNF